MKIAAVFFCFLQVAAVNSRLFRREDYKNIDNNLFKDPIAKDTAELLMEGRQRTLFARRGVYGRQKLRVSKPIGGPLSPKVAPSPPKAVPPPPATPQCSRTMESCLPHSRCCDPCASCHCRFFNAICYCRKTSRHCQKAAWGGQ